MSNLVVSPYSDAESGTASDYWYITFGSVTRTFSTDFAYAGSQSLKAVAGNASYFQLESTPAFAASDADTYSVSCRIRSSAGGWATFDLMCYNAGGNFIGSVNVEGKASTTSWVAYQATGLTLPAGTAFVGLRIEGYPPQAGDIFYFDAFVMDNGVGSVATVNTTTIATTSAVDTAGVATGADATAQPAVVATGVAIPATAHAGVSSATPSIATIATGVTIPTPAAVAHSSSATPAVIVTGTTIHPFAVATTAATVVAQTIQTAITFAGYSARLTHQVQSTEIGTSTAVPAPNTNETAPPAMTTVTASVTIPVPTVSTSSGAGVATGTATIASTVTIPTPTIAALSAATSLVVRDLISMTRRQLHTFHRPQYNLLAAPGVNAGERTIRFQYPLQGITAGSLISIDDELIYVLSAAPSLLEVQGLRGAEGTFATNHDPDALVEVGIRYPTVEIRRALADEIRSWPTAIYRTGHVDLNVGHGVTSIDLAGVPPEFTRILDVRRAPAQGECADDWVRVSYRVDRDSHTGSFASGAALTFPRGIGHATTVRVVYAAPFNTVDMADDVRLMEDIGLSTTLLDAAQLGALWRLVLPREIRRADIDVQGQPRRAEEVPAGHNAQTARQMKAIRDERIREEAKRLLTRYPMRMAS